MGNVVKLYYTERSNDNKEWELIPSKLLVVESIATYLLTKSSKCTTINDFQYIKNKLELSINVDLAQSYSQPKATTSYKYVSIQNEGELIHYYFVKSAEWRSKTCVRLELVMDVLNTFEEGKDYTFKPNTRIIREHKDRLTKTPLVVNCAIGNTIGSAGTISVGDTIKAYRNESGDFILICTGKVLEIYEESISIQVSSNETYEDIKDQFDRGVQYADEFQFSKDNANYFECYLDQVVYNFNYVRKIDYINENINPVLQCGSGEGTLLNDKTPLNKDWYLLYRNQNEPSDSLVNPVDCFLIPSEDIDTDSAVIENGRLIPSWLDEGKWYIFQISSGKSATLSNGTTISYASSRNTRLVLTKAGNKINAIGIRTTADGIPYDMWFLFQFDDITYVDFTGMPINYATRNDFDNVYASDLATMNFPYTFSNTSNSTLDNISTLDRTDAKNIKLIKLPYCPYDFEVSGGVLQISGDSNWELYSLTQSGGGIVHYLKLNSLDTELKRDIVEDEDINPMNRFSACDNTDIEPNKNDLRITSVELESKLYHSEFYSPQLVYDSFAYKYELEKLNQEWYYDSSNNKNEIRFIMTRTINSKFMFEMKSLKFAMSESNYSKYLPIARNNEEVLYNVPYINYIRTGYNYDIKNKNTSRVSNIIGLGLSGASIGVSLALPSAPLKVAGVVASIVSFAMSIKNTIVSELNNENSIRQKQEQYQNQASSVAGSDDVDLMSVYASNRLKYLVYEPNPKMKALLQDLFFYAGYNSGRMGLPNHNTRLNFDYLECEASIECLSSMPEDCVQELVNALKTGITYLHKTTRTSDIWDFDQKYENWEKSLL